MKYTVYILFSETLNRFYIGYTSEAVERRLYRHNSNHKGFTGKQADWTIKHTEQFDLKVEAMKREKQIKDWKSRKMTEKLCSF